jgi:small subunit ribosomal protein S25e
MGGGKKNKSLTQMTKSKAPKQAKPKREKTDQATAATKSLGIIMPDINSKKVMGELKGLKVLTPSVVASKFSVRLSIATAFLKELEKRKMVEYVSGGKNLKIYKATAVAQ